jgi:hypothetical protein
MLIKLLLLEEINKEETIIEHEIKLCNTNLFFTRKIEGLYNIMVNGLVRFNFLRSGRSRALTATCVRRAQLQRCRETILYENGKTSNVRPKFRSRYVSCTSRTVLSCPKESHIRYGVQCATDHVLPFICVFH